MSTIKSTQAGSQLADDLTQGADNAIHSTQRAANSALDQLSNKVHEVGDQAAPLINRLSAQAEALSHRVVDAVRDGSKRARMQATPWHQHRELHQGRARQVRVDRGSGWCSAAGHHQAAAGPPRPQLITRPPGPWKVPTP